MTKLKKSIGILGGTFDPIHRGHLAIANHVLTHFNLSTIEFIPAKIPPHRTTPTATPEQRVAMVELAIQDNPHFHLNDIEIKREGTSYMVDTLAELRQRFPETPLLLIIGEDAFVHLNTWHRWKTILDLTHLIVINRPNTSTPKTDWIISLRKQHETNTKNDLQQFLHGKIYFETITPILTSATQIRQQIQSNEDTKSLLPDAVSMYILRNHLYRS